MNCDLSVLFCIHAHRLVYSNFRRIPPELGRLTRLRVLEIDDQKTPPSLDSVGGTQGYEWSAYPTVVRHVHNADVLVKPGGVWSTGPVEARNPCNTCTSYGRLDGGSFPEASCSGGLYEHQRLERERAAKGEPSRPEPTMTCRVCGVEQKISTLQAHPELRCERIRNWLPSLSYNQVCACTHSVRGVAA